MYLVYIFFVRLLFNKVQKNNVLTTITSYANWITKNAQNLRNYVLFITFYSLDFQRKKSAIGELVRMRSPVQVRLSAPLKKP